MKKIIITYKLAAIFLLASYAGINSAMAADCQPSTNNCDFYFCKENYQPCGEKGYWGNFAIPYCQAFLKDQINYSKPAQVFLKKVRFCLQDEINIDTQFVGCSDIKKTAFRAHVNCYVDSGFCHLNYNDRLRIALNVREAFLDKLTWYEAFAVNERCLSLNALQKLR